jgi:long-chain fatty acid transport protein
MFSKLTATVTTFLVAGFCGIAGQALAAGFAIKEQSGAALGNAFAGATAGAEDISYMFFNPAGLTRHSGSQVLGIASYIAPQAEFSGGSASTVLTTPISGGNGGDDIANNALVPVFYAMWDVNPDLKLGLGINAPWGLVTDYDGDWIGRYHAERSELHTINVNPAVAYKLHDMISIGAGLQAQYIDVSLSQAIDFGSIDQALFAGAFGGVPGGSDGRGKVKGDDIGFGYTLGVLFEPWESTRVGLGYRSMVAHELEGDGTFDPGGPVGAGISGFTGQFVNTGVKASVKLPETVSFGFHQDIDNQWSVMGEASWTHWSRFRELRIRFDNPSQADSVTDESWENQWFVAAGVTYRPDQDWTIRAGVAFDESPIPDRTRTPRIAGEDRTWIAVGAGYEPFENMKIEFGYTHIFVDDSTLDLTASGIGNTFRGNLAGEYEGSIDILTLQGSLKF